MLQLICILSPCHIYHDDPAGMEGTEQCPVLQKEQTKESMSAGCNISGAFTQLISLPFKFANTLKMAKNANICHVLPRLHKVHYKLSV